MIRSQIHRITMASLLIVWTTSLLSAAAPASRKWEKDIQAFEATDRTRPPPENVVLFIGSSSTRFWTTLQQDFPDQKVINRGFGGSQFADAVYYADRIVIPYMPRLIVLQEGSNDIHAGKSPEQVLAGFKAFVEKVRAALPNVRIAYQSINPAPVRWAEREKQRKANELIRQYIASGKNLDYIDMWDAFLGPDGQPRKDLFRKDGLHNNNEGYKIRAALVRSHLKGPS